MLNAVGDIIHASCSCPDGSGPSCTCKHTAALCYALEDFVKVFVLPEDIPSCTGKSNFQLFLSMILTLLENKAWGKRKQNRQLKGEQPEAYKLNKVCDSERDSAESFLSAMKYELDMEPTVINRYVAEKVKEGSNISIKKLGLIIDKDHGFLAVSPDGGIEENNSLVGIVECKVAVKWSHQTVVDCVKEPGYPLKSMKINQHGTSVQVFGLKPNYDWYHQIQLQLYVCRSFAKYCDLALLHPDSGSLYCQRF
ncbi:hypothetical protein ACJMK2_001228 [Sinanodonta woodiana]|uniref:SWIM-type domain-containing protein n=1 Tax=Sinanodonta woodiana TaxID=1069815 RepID=A0ABD3XV12_SINWO